MSSLDSSLNEYDFHLPEEQIAKEPAKTREGSRLLLVNRGASEISEAPYFSNIGSWLRPGDVLVYNETKVSHRRVYLQVASGRVHESIFLEEVIGNPLDWTCILKNRAKLKLGEKLHPLSFPNFSFTYMGAKEELSILRADKKLEESDFDAFGNIPIPPYLKRESTPEDSDRYQTIFAKTPGSVAAPTAGLHFSEELKENLRKQNVNFVPVELRIGYGTFQPLSEQNLQEKRLHSESFVMSSETSEILNVARRENQRVIAIGTTALRVLESVFDPASKTYEAKSGQTDIFLMPGDPILSIQGLITNFHLPKSSLILLVSAFAGKDLVLKSYHYALERNFRFYSYGDAMFLF
ncbi:MAG: tRNA preQ1(34) S-adenosylmethionine ribosyltransferase-isomerase QueA [Leptospira sp.]|nr:tRNA preQ1(34) S-adenosylmethionine ribosyltransferase-isomerase QueA [Leptospira sp.]